MLQKEQKIFVKFVTNEMEQKIFANENLVQSDIIIAFLVHVWPFAT